MQDITNKNTKVLIFGSINCEMTQKAIRFLKSQHCEITEYLTGYTPAANKHTFNRRCEKLAWRLYNLFQITIPSTTMITR